MTKPGSVASPPQENAPSATILPSPILIPLRLQAFAHLLVFLLLLPFAGFLGLLAAPLLLALPIWFLIVGLGLWRPTLRAVLRARRAYWAALILAPLLIAYGAFALDAASRSARAGGGLLGGFGLLPLGAGVLLAAFALMGLTLTAAAKRKLSAAASS